MFFEILFNRKCLICFKYGKYICRDCFYKNIGKNLILRCHVCNSETRIGLVHKECLENTYLDGVISLSSYTNTLKHLIFKVKYQYIYQIFKDLGEFLSDYFKEFNILNKNILITCVPLSKKKMNLRGFNQAEVLAKVIANKLNIPYVNLLQRNKDTKALYSQDKYSRKESIVNAFKVNQEYINLLENTKFNTLDSIVIVDDIYTTGTTLNECAKVLKQLYKVKVYGVVLAKV